MHTHVPQSKSRIPRSDLRSPITNAIRYGPRVSGRRTARSLWSAGRCESGSTPMADSSPANSMTSATKMLIARCRSTSHVDYGQGPFLRIRHSRDRLSDPVRETGNCLKWIRAFVSRDLRGAPALLIISGRERYRVMNLIARSSCAEHARVKCHENDWSRSRTSPFPDESLPSTVTSRTLVSCRG